MAPMLRRMSTATLHPCELLFPSAQSQPRSLVIIGATGQVGFGKLCQLTTRLALAPGPMVPVVALDPSHTILKLQDKLRNRLSKSLNASQVQRVIEAVSLIQGTVQDLPEGLDIGVALEAVPEVLATKRAVHQALLDRQKPPALLASTTSAYTSQTLFGNYALKERCAVLHPFFPHHKNPLWELPCKGAVTSLSMREQIHQLMHQLDLTIIEVADVPAFAADRVFCGLMLHAVRACEELDLSPKQFDKISQELIGCAPFYIHNIIPGANALSMHCIELCHQEHPSTLFEIPKSWRPYRDDPKRTWPVDDLGSPSTELQDAARERILGSLACICAYLLHHDIIQPAHLDQLCTNALGFRQGPCALFRDLGIPHIQAIAQAFITNNKITQDQNVAPLAALSRLN